MSFIIATFCFPFQSGLAQDSICLKKYTGQVARAARLVGGGQSGIAEDVLHQIEKEVTAACPDSGILADIACLKGNIRFLRDNPEGALAYYRSARNLAVSLAQLSRIDQNTGASYFSLNEYEKAVRWFSHALSELDASGLNAPRRFLDLYDNLGSACYEIGDLEAAGKWWGRSMIVAAKYFPTDSLLRSKTAHNAALVLFGQNDWDRAVKLFRLALDIYPENNDPRDPFISMVTKNLALALVKSGSPAEAEALLSLYDQPGQDLVFQAEILRLKSWIRFSEGKYMQAVSILESGSHLVPTMEGKYFSGLSALEDFRLLRDRSSILFLQSESKTDTSPEQVYRMQMQACAALEKCISRDGRLPGFMFRHDSLDLLLRRTLETGCRLLPSGHATVEELLAIAGLCRGGTDRSGPMVCAVDSSIPDSLGDLWLSLNRQLYRLEKRELQEAVRTGIEDHSHEDILFEIRNRLDSVTDLILYAGGEDPSLILQTFYEQGDLMKSLSPSEAILDYNVFHDKIFLGILRMDTAVLIPVVPDPGFPEILNEFRTSLCTADDPAFERLCPVVSELLAAPALPWLNGVEHLVIIPGGLGGIPFDCLMPKTSGCDKELFMAERFAISYYRSGKEIIKRKNTEVAGRYVPDCNLVAFSPYVGDETRKGDLPFAMDEAEEIGELFSEHGGRVKIFSGEQADETTLLAEIPSEGIIHIATHSKVDPKNPVQSGLQMWKQSPVTSGDELIDGILELGEVRGIRLNCDLLTLSSCTMDAAESVEKVHSPKPESWFLDAGARRVLSGLWNVSDRHTRTLMCDFYRNYLNGDDFPEALQKAKVKMLHNPATASPYLWAAFILTER